MSDNNFNRTESLTYADLSQTVKASYGSGYVQGAKSQERLCIPGEPWCKTSLVIYDGKEQSCNEICADLSMIYVTKQSGLGSLMCDGILGLSPTNQNDPDMDLFIEQAYAQGSIPEKVFSLSIGPGSKPSSITFGGYDLETFATGDIKWHPTIQDQHWEVGLSGFSVGDTKVPISMNKTLVDSGTSYISMPQSEFYALYQELKLNQTCFKSSFGGTEIIFC